MADGHCWLTVAASCACMLGELQLCRGGPLHWIRDAARVAAAMALAPILEANSRRIDVSWSDGPPSRGLRACSILGPCMHQASSSAELEEVVCMHVYKLTGTFWAAGAETGSTVCSCVCRACNWMKRHCRAPFRTNRAPKRGKAQQRAKRSFWALAGHGFAVSWLQGGQLELKLASSVGPLSP